MEAFSFGSYYPGDSAVHRLDPRTKLLLGFAFLITVLTVGSFCGLVPVAIFVVLVYVMARVPLRRVLSSMAPLLAIVVVVAVLNLFSDQSGRILWRLGFLQVSEGSLRSATFMTCRLTLMMAGMSAITLTTPTLDLTAGFVRMLGSVAIPLFTGVFRHAETLSAAMDARCYHGEQGRTRLHALAFGRGDALAALAMALLVTCVVVMNLQLV